MGCGRRRRRPKQPRQPPACHPGCPVVVWLWSAACQRAHHETLLTLSLFPSTLFPIFLGAFIVLHKHLGKHTYMTQHCNAYMRRECVCASSAMGGGVCRLRGAYASKACFAVPPIKQCFEYLGAAIFKRHQKFGCAAGELSSSGHQLLAGRCWWRRYRGAATTVRKGNAPPTPAIS